MSDKTLSWAIAEIETKMANAVRQRAYYRRLLNDPGENSSAGYLVLIRGMRQSWDGQLLGLNAARKIVVQADEGA